MSSILLKTVRKRQARRSGWFGIDIGSSAVKIAKVERYDGQFIVTQKRIVPNNSGDPIVNACDSAQAFTNWRSQFTSCPAAITSSLNLDLRSLEVPPTERDNVEAFLANQPGLVGSGITTAVWPTTWNMPANEMLPCHVFGHQQILADEIAHTIHEAGLTPLAMESTPHVLARLPKLNNWLVSEVHAVIDWAAENPLFVLSRHGEPFYTRLMKRCEFSQLINEVSEKLKLETNDVWQLLSELGRASCDDRRFSKIVTTLREVSQITRQHFLSEINKTITYLESQDEQLVPDKIWVVGAGASYPMVSSLIEETTHIPTEIWSLPSEDSSSKELAYYASAISLSARPFFQ